MFTGISKLMSAMCHAPLTLVLSGIALLLFFYPSLALSLELRNEAAGYLHPLSLFGCHLLHWSAEHLFWDLGMFVVTGYLCERAGRRAYLWTLGIAAVAIPCLVAWYHPELSTYRGLSGLDTALFALLICRTGLRAGGDSDPAKFWSCLGLWLAMFGKSVFELSTGEVLFVNAENFVPVPVAHLVGMICGSAVAFTTNVPTEAIRYALQSNRVSATSHSTNTTKHPQTACSLHPNKKLIVSLGQVVVGHGSVLKTSQLKDENECCAT